MYVSALGASAVYRANIAPLMTSSLSPGKRRLAGDRVIVVDELGTAANVSLS
jgi:hypothetical protein